MSPDKNHPSSVNDSLVSFSLSQYPQNTFSPQNDTSPQEGLLFEKYPISGTS